MKKILFNKMNYLLNITKPIYSIAIDSQEIYRDIGYNIIDSITYSEDNKIIDISKYGLVIYDLFHINLSEKKLLTSLYKRLENHIDDECIRYISEIEQNIFNLFDKLSYNSNIPIDYSEDADITKFLSIYNVSFPKIETTNYLELLLNYFKLYNEFLKTKVIICFGLLSILTEEETSLLENELNHLDITLIDINYRSKKDLKSDLFVDSDWCII